MIKYFHCYELSLVAKKFRDRTETLYFESLVTIVKIMHQSSPTTGELVRYIPVKGS